MISLTTQAMDSIRTEGYLPLSEPADSIFSRLSRSRVVGGRLPQSNTGLYYLDNVFSHRFMAKTSGSISLHDAFHDDTQMKRVINYIIESGREPSKELILRNLKFNIKTPSHFFPDTAAALCAEYAKGGNVYDVFTGWGGRSLGAICSGASWLVSTDLQRESFLSGKQMASDFSTISNTVCDFRNVDFVDYSSNTDKKFDLIIASPPFFDTEDYGNGNKTIRQWVTDILIPMTKFRRILKDGGYIAIHGQDRPGVPVLSFIYSAFSCAGYKLKAEHKYGKKPGQSVLIWGNHI
jgi:16S rRNA G966 N2-methylase RsmD